MVGMPSWRLREVEVLMDGGGVRRVGADGAEGELAETLKAILIIMPTPVWHTARNSSCES